MKAIFINGSPRKNWNTAQMLDSAMKGAADAGLEVERINLFDYEFTGCRSCFACKIKNSKTNGVCAIRDSIRPVIEKCQDADVIVIGSPVYFGYPTGSVRYGPEASTRRRSMMLSICRRILWFPSFWTSGILP